MPALRDRSDARRSACGNFRGRRGGARAPDRPIPSPGRHAAARPRGRGAARGPHGRTGPEPSPTAEPAEPVRRAAAPAAATDAELTCLTRVILYEAGAESRAGQLAVAQVVLNRVRSGRFPRTICGVINQRGQFAAIRGFHPPRNARWNRALALARSARAGERVPSIGNALFFHAARIRPFNGRTRVDRLGGHIFYR